MKWSPEELHPGDIIRVKIGSVYHYGIFCSEEEVVAFGVGVGDSLLVNHCLRSCGQLWPQPVQILFDVSNLVQGYGRACVTFLAA